MGMNYYLLKDVCGKCGKPNEKLHIGKSSGGWTFSFHGYRNKWDDYHLTTWHQWQEFLRKELDCRTQIQNEDGNKIALEDFIKLVEGKKSEKLNHTTYCLNTPMHRQHGLDSCWLDDEGNSFSEG